MDDEYIELNELIKVVSEIDSRYTSCNLLFSEYHELSWVELCNKGISLLEKLRDGE